MTRVPAPPTPPTHPALRVACETIERMCAQLEQARQEDASLAIALARASLSLRDTGIAEIETLPPTVRRACENALYAAMTLTRGESPELRTQVLRALYVGARITSEAYELEGTGDTAPPAGSGSENSLDSGQPPTA